jgi:hypothetical protein
VANPFADGTLSPPSDVPRVEWGGHFLSARASSAHDNRISKFQTSARIQIFNGGERRSDVWDPEIPRCSYRTCASGTISDIGSLDQYEKNWMLLSGLNNKRVKKERRRGGRRGGKRSREEGEEGDENR